MLVDLGTPTITPAAVSRAVVSAAGTWDTTVRTSCVPGLCRFRRTRHRRLATFVPLCVWYVSDGSTDAINPIKMYLNDDGNFVLTSASSGQPWSLLDSTTLRLAWQ